MFFNCNTYIMKQHLFIGLEVSLYGLAYNCPTQHRQDDCPFKQEEHLTFKEKVDWIDGLTKDIKQIIIEEHKKCSNHSV